MIINLTGDGEVKFFHGHNQITFNNDPTESVNTCWRTLGKPDETRRGQARRAKALRKLKKRYARLQRDCRK